MDNTALITVLMSVHNGMPYLPEAVESIFRQTFQRWQFVIIDDGSSDDSAAYLDRLTDQRVKVVHQEQQGLAAALNHGLQYCEAELIARLDSDDVALPERLSRQYAFMQRHPEVGLLGTQFKRLGRAQAGFPSRLPCDHAAIMQALLLGRHALCHPTIVCRTSLLRDVGGYWQHPIAQDWDMYLKMGERSRLANLEEILLHYRIHNASLNGKRLADIRQHQRFAAECARRRHERLPPIGLAEFMQIEQQLPLLWRWHQRLNEVALHHYRNGLANILGQHRVVGYLQLGAAAVCSPTLTRQRLQRISQFRSAARPPVAIHKVVANVTEDRTA
jgi:glycosyltransferase involved in cell wall biosynthesis